MNALESVSIAIDAVRSQKLRSGLTLLSVGIGVFAIIAATSIMSTLSRAVSGQLADLGENSLLIQRTPTINFGTNWAKMRRRKNITYMQAKEFRDRMSSTNQIAISNQNPGMTVKSGQESTNPDVTLIGIDEMYFVVNAVSVSAGRPVTESEVATSRPVAIIGQDVVAALFPKVDPVGQLITLKNQSFLVIGVLTKKGGVLGQSQDNRVLIPITVFNKYYTWEWDASVDISVKAINKLMLMETKDEATGIMRALRGVKPWEENNFEIDANDALSGQFSGFTSAILAVAWISGLGALVAAGIGIMNMMLVSVKERTREIGVRKALGARRRWIIRQFLVESITLCQLGGTFGMLGGIAASWGVTELLREAMPSITYVFPTATVIFSIVICTIIGLAFGMYPAWRAAKLDPIEALRYE
ncbi:MAG: FtsX-like permease family protein [Candidatus Kapabacteria bacterium]|nr:FtsX-like permease family protein [Candidatus Kapabacteria bacterium]